MAFVAYTWGPVWFHLPVPVTVNGHAYEVKSGTKVRTFLSAHFNLVSYQGALKADTGQVLDPKGGKLPRIKVDGHVLYAHEQIGRRATITLARGADIIHPTKQKTVTLSPKAAVKGNGALIGPLHAGKSGTELQTIDTVTGKVLTSKVITPPVDMLLRAYVTTTVKPKVVALTFDDGPHKDYTAAILAILQQEKIPATFFELGNNIKRYPALSKAVVSGGNLVGLHSWDHKDFTKLTAAQIDSQLGRTQTAFKAATGWETSWFRLPYGNSTPQVDGQLVTHGFRLAYWTVDTNDWKRPGPDAIVAAALKGARPGAIILMHDGGGDRSQTVAALPKIIAGLKAQGYGFVTVDGLYKLSGGK